MPKAIFNDAVIAESDDTIVVENNHYFPPESVNQDLLRPTDAHTTCPWKGVASYYNVVVDGAMAEQAAWYYPNPKPAAEEIRNHVAFWKDVRVEE